MKVSRGILIVQIALLALIVFWGVRAVLAFSAPQSVWQPFEQSPALTVNANPSLDVGARQVNLNFDPFHREQAIAPAEANLGEDAPETTLNLTLVGRRSGQSGTAILVTPDGKQNVFRIDDEILPGVTLKSVNVDYIVISQEGRLERLTFMKDEQSGLQPYVPETQTQPSLEPSNVNAPLKSPKPSKPIRAGSAQTPIKPNRSQAMSPILTALNFTPERVDNAVIGYQVSPKHGDFNMASLGLQNGDVITAIGNTNLQSENVDFQSVLLSLQGRQTVGINLIRKGRSISLNVGAP